MADPQFNEQEFQTQADLISVSAEGTEDIRTFIEEWFQWEIGDPTWADQMFEMLSLPPERRAEQREEWQ